MKCHSINQSINQSLQKAVFTELPQSTQSNINMERAPSVSRLDLLNAGGVCLQAAVYQDGDQVGRQPVCNYEYREVHMLASTAICY